jgi:hypothetical protein
VNQETVNDWSFALPTVSQIYGSAAMSCEALFDFRPATHIPQFFPSQSNILGDDKKQGVFPRTGRIPLRDLADTATAESTTPLGVAVDNGRSAHHLVTISLTEFQFARPILR